MQILEIYIRNYKSITSWQRITWGTSLMTLIGKNGSGKTNFLEALSVVFDANTNSNYNIAMHERINFDYKIVMKLDKGELSKIDASLEYIPENYTVEAYCEGGGHPTLRINKIKSPTIVKSIKQKEGDLGVLAKRLIERLDAFNALLDNFSTEAANPSPMFSCEVTSLGSSTNYSHHIDYWKRIAEDKVREVKEYAKRLVVDDEYLQIGSYFYSPLSIDQFRDFAFEIEYCPPKLAKFESPYITIDRQKIEQEIARINQAAEAERQEINEIARQISQITKTLSALSRQESELQVDETERHFSIIKAMQKKICHRCFFLRNDNGGLMFSKEQGGYYQHYSNINAQLILEAYIRTHVKESEREGLLKGLSEGKLQFKDPNAVARQLEEIINSDIPTFDKGMYSGVKAVFERGTFALKLLEHGGKEVDFNSTNSGRRWFYTYYFIKKCIKAGDILIIDEPAAYLHPQAQSEIMRDLEKLAGQGCRVIISTHSPYMISDKVPYYYDVRMTTGGTTINRVSLKEFMGIREELGFVGFNNIILGAEKRVLLVEGEGDVAAIKTFMRVFDVDSTQFNIFQLDGAAKTSTIYRFIRTTSLNYKLLLDEDTKINYPDQIAEIDMTRTVFAGTGTAELAIEGLFAEADKKYFSMQQTRKGRKLKVDKHKISRVSKKENLNEATVAAFERLFKQLEIIL